MNLRPCPPSNRRHFSGLRGPGLAALAGTLALAACSSGPGASNTTSTSTTLPPLPPKVIAYVALAGTGANLGFGSGLVPVDVSVGSTGVGSRLKVGSYPDAVATTSNGRLVLVANFSSNTVTPILEPNGTVLPAIPVGAGPAGIAVSPDDKTAFVTDSGGNSAVGDTVTPIDLQTLKPEKPITVGPGPQGIAITATTVYVADAGAVIAGQPGTIGDTVTPISLLTHRAGRPIRVGNGPLGIAATPDGATVYVTNLNSESVTPISTATEQALAPIPVAGGPVAVVVAQKEAWVVNAPATGQAGNNVQPISTLTNRAGIPIKTPRGAQAIAVTPDGSTAWVACLDTDTIVPIDLATRKAGSPIRVIGGPFAIAIADQPQSPSSIPGPPKKKPGGGGSSTTTT
jgi:hyaluronoglucosaminidase